MEEGRVMRLSEKDIAQVGGNKEKVTAFAKTLCESLVSDPEKDCVVFPSSMSSYLRKIFHAVAGQLALEHFSVEKEGERRLLICKVIDPNRLFNPDPPTLTVEQVTKAEVRVKLLWTYEQRAPVHKVTITVQSLSSVSESVSLVEASKDGVALTNAQGDAQFADNCITSHCVFSENGLTVALRTDFQYGKCELRVSNLRPGTVYVVTAHTGHDGASSEAVKAVIQTLGEAKGKLKCWGNGTQGAFGFVAEPEEILNRPTDFSSTVAGIAVSSFSAGYYHSSAVSDQGSLVTWGRVVGMQENSESPQLIPSMPLLLTPAQPVKFCKVACADTHNLAVSVCGQVYAWGLGNAGELGLGMKQFSQNPERIETYEDDIIVPPFFTDVSCSQMVSLALTKDGAVFEWGLVMHPAQTMVPVSISRPKYVKSNIGGSVAVRISAGAGYKAVVLRNRELYTWGINLTGVLGNGTSESCSFPVRLDLADVSDVSCGTTHSAAVLTTGAVATWGKGKNGQLGQNDYANSLIPRIIDGFASVTQVACNGNHTLFLRNDGSIWACGEGKNGCLGIGVKGKVGKPVRVRCEGTATGVAAGVVHSLAAFT